MSKANQNAVYFTPIVNDESLVSISSKLESLFQKAGFDKLIQKGDFVALKMHLGEEKKKSFISPIFVRVIVDLVKEAKAKPFVTDTNTLYEGPRVNAVDHLTLAARHGFSYEQLGCPVIIADGLIGENQVSVVTPSGRIHIAGLAKRVDVIIALTHCTGHLLTGYGGAIKNIAMGLAGRGGKLDQHSGVKPEIIASACKACEVCIIHCPAEAITLKNGKSYIDKNICYGCGECFAVCPHSAVKVDKWHATSDHMQAKMARYCAGILKGKKSGFINFATTITKNCDCVGNPEKSLLSDVGILASSDPVAIDTASIDLINQKAGQDIFKSAWPEIDYTIQFKESEKLGVGSRTYKIK